MVTQNIIMWLKVDRFDLKVEVAFKAEQNGLRMDSDRPIETVPTASMNSKVMFERIKRVNEIQYKRYGNDEVFNGNLSPKDVLKYCKLNSSAEKWVCENLQVSGGGDSMRHHHKILKLARTIADFDASELIDKKHLIEAFYYNRRKLG